MLKPIERVYLNQVPMDHLESSLDFASLELSDFHLIDEHPHFNTLHSGKDIFVLPLKKRPVKRRMAAFNQFDFHL